MLKHSLYTFLLSSLLLISGCMEVKEVEFIGIEDAHVEKMSQNDISVEVLVKIKNPNNFNIKIVKSDLDILMKGKPIGKAVIQDRIVLKKNSTDVHKITIKAKLSDIMSGGLAGMLSMFTGGTLDIQIKGWIKARAKGITKKIDVDHRDQVPLR